MSVFTYDPDPPRVSSPWLQPADPGKRRDPPASDRGSAAVNSDLLADYGVTKLAAEPELGPTEYKLHLLLRQRRIFRSMSTTNRIAGSQQARPTPPEPKALLKHRAVVMSTSNQTRQSRFLQLTTQLFWRLRQSSPYHASVANQELVIPHLPDDYAASSVSVKPGKPLPGLEESRGALYEIGVADDGTLVGLTKDEMDESIANLSIMAASLGCVTEVLRRVIVGDCEWLEEPPSQVVHRGELWVAEVLVTPNFGACDQQLDGCEHTNGATSTSFMSTELNPSAGPATKDQLRVTLTGPTTSGKSTLLGTLSTGTLDNGHGKSRLSLLRHRHELASGVTSSVAQELIGYKGSDIVNYSNRNIESWIGIHDFTADGRLVFVSDSAGHPRYRRTILRGIVGWAPHWTVLCLAADCEEPAGNSAGTPSTSYDAAGLASAGLDLARSHLELCLRLQIPLAIVVTKMDKGTKSGLQGILGKVLSSIKQAGRTPRLLHPGRKSDPDMAKIPQEDTDKVGKIVGEMVASGDLLATVPIVLASAVNGTGIGLMHALLKQLPLPPAPTAYDLTGPALNPDQPTSLFHIEDKFSLPASHASVGGNSVDQTDVGTVVAGYIRFGKLSVGDAVVVGPFPSDEDDGRASTSPEGRQSPGSYGLSVSHPSTAELNRIASRSAVSASTIKGEWHNARVVSLRNLRLPVLTLEAGQVGTVGLVLDVPSGKVAGENGLLEAPPQQGSHRAPKIRKGMVLAIRSKHMLDGAVSLQAASGLTALFRDPDAASLIVGSLVNIYVASVRAAARVLRVTGVAGTSPPDSSSVPTEDIDDVFNLNEEQLSDDGAGGGMRVATPNGVEVRLELMGNREWIELGSRIVLLEGGRHDRSGLEGFSGKVVEIVD
ncbi:hypothetical protein MAPG_06681 [Magnaporthiopsis poae ATCC 64411]|uniref:Tr-type G domain-containing protein n=1 Tax=Magnaporthiopsis poae (strain ATCC 64411 / 73-15) TaxID=644358 RepID=A0A0C4E2P1_MAGP6|nr:hypothetical protein MAPG_06681 [Magnaporthiopsis poae ATCC 64411]